MNDRWRESTAGIVKVGKRKGTSTFGFTKWFLPGVPHIWPSPELLGRMRPHTDSVNCDQARNADVQLQVEAVDESGEYPIGVNFLTTCQMPKFGTRVTFCVRSLCLRKSLRFE